MEVFSSFLKGALSFVTIIIDNWSTIVVGAALGVYAYYSVKKFMQKTTDEKIAIAKSKIEKFMLSYVSQAEKDYADWFKAGDTKRAQVIARIYADYPILDKVVDQERLIEWIDNVIKEALKRMREMVSPVAE